MIWKKEKRIFLITFISREINLEEAKVLVAALNSEDVALLIETLSSI